MTCNQPLHPRKNRHVPAGFEVPIRTPYGSGDFPSETAGSHFEAFMAFTAHLGAILFPLAGSSAVSR